MKLSRRHRKCFYSAFSILFFSGLLWFVLHYGFSYVKETCFPVRPLEVWSLKIHGAAAMFALVILGTLIPQHIKKGWKDGLNRRNGVIVIAANLLLIVSGYGLYYAGGEWARSFSTWIHVSIGFLLPGLIFWHVQEGRRSRKKMHHRPIKHATS